MSDLVHFSATSLLYPISICAEASWCAIEKNPRPANRQSFEVVLFLRLPLFAYRNIVINTIVQVKNKIREFNNLRTTNWMNSPKNIIIILTASLAEIEEPA